MGALDIDKGQVKNIYAIAAKLGMVDRSSHEDALHELVQGLTGKTSVKDLTHSEALEVLTELRRRSTPATPKKNGRGNMTKHRAASVRRSRKKCGTSCSNLKSSTRHRRACSCGIVCAV